MPEPTNLTKADFLAAISDLNVAQKSYVDGLEQRLFAELANKEQRLLLKIHAMDHRLSVEIAAAEQRLTLEISKQTERVETRLLMAFHNYARRAEVLRKRGDAIVESLGERMELVESRLDDIDDLHRKGAQ